MSENALPAIDRTKYVGGKKATAILGVHYKTLHLWEERGQIETIRMPGGKRLYNVEKFIKDRQMTIDSDTVNYTEVETEVEEKLKIIYARVSSLGQKDDLERQKKELKRLYPEHKMIEEIGSGMDMNRKGLRRIIRLAIAGKVEEVVVMHKDRLARFGYELVEDLIREYSNGVVKVVERKEEVEPEEELVKDVLTMMNIFVARMNGMRKYNKRKGINVIKKIETE